MLLDGQHLVNVSRGRCVLALKVEQAYCIEQQENPLL